MAIVEDGATIGEDVTIGPFCTIGRDVVLKDNVEVVSNAVVTGKTEIGKGCRIFPMAVIGGLSQSLHEAGEDSTLTIGDNCTMREGVTINMGTVGGGGGLGARLRGGTVEALLGGEGLGHVGLLHGVASGDR